MNLYGVWTPYKFTHLLREFATSTQSVARAVEIHAVIKHVNLYGSLVQTNLLTLKVHEFANGTLSGPRAVQTHALVKCVNLYGTIPYKFTHFESAWIFIWQSVLPESCAIHALIRCVNLHGTPYKFMHLLRAWICISAPCLAQEQCKIRHKKSV